MNTAAEITRLVSPMKPSEKQVEPAEEAHLQFEDTLRAEKNIFPKSDEGVMADGLITQEMIDEEKKLQEETLADEQKFLEKSLQNKDEKEQCFKRLLHLLNRSNIYAQFLVKKMEQQEEQEKKKRELEMQQKERQSLKELHQLANVQKHPETRGQSKSPNNQVFEDRNFNSRQRKKQQKSSVKTLESGENQSTVIGKSLKRKRNEMKLSDYFGKEELCKQVSQPEETVLPHDTFCRIINDERVSDRQPTLFSGGVMRGYQLEGFEWLKVLYENGVNGILADEMGLGKTIQCIALLAHLMKMGVPGPFLICAPLSTLPNWMLEFQRFTPKIPVILYHGLKTERVALREKINRRLPLDGNFIHPVVVTSYEIAMKDRSKFARFEWRYIIVDEGHRIKNFQCKLVRELKQYHSVNRLLLTGTPLQNNLAELWSLLNFLLPEIFDDLQVFESWFDITTLTRKEGDEQIIAQEQEKQIISTIHQILAPFLLRRTKADIELNLPPKKEIIVYAPLSSQQQTFYAATVDRTIKKLIENKGNVSFEDQCIMGEKRKRKYVREINYSELENSESDEDYESLPKVDLDQSSDTASVSKPNSKLFETSIKMQNILMLLRKICNHPYLLEYPLDASTNEYKIDEQLIKASGKLLVLDSMLPELKKRGHKILIFSQMVMMLRILQDYCEFRNFRYNLLHGSIKLEDRQEQIKDFNENPLSFLFLISTRAGGLGINLASADTVIIYDSDWNPQCDLQAQDRCHRIGQTKPVVVYRLVTADTVDEKIVVRASAKRKLEKLIIQNGRFSSSSNLTSKSKKILSTEELIALLQSADYKGLKYKDGSVFSPKELNILLDRSDMLPEPDCRKSRLTEKRSNPTEVKGLFKVVNQMSSSL